MMSVSSSVLNKKLTPLMVALVASSALFLSACNDSNTPADTKKAEALADLSIFAGCYTVMGYFYTFTHRHTDTHTHIFT